MPSKEELKQDVAAASKSATQSLRDFAAGGVGGVCAVVVGHPFDLAKVRLQTAEKGVYSGAMDVVRKTVAREGPVRVRNASSLFLLLSCIAPSPPAPQSETVWCESTLGSLWNLDC